MKVEIYIHGYCMMNEAEKYGGYCATAVYKTYDFTVTGLGSNTTSNVLEIQALIHALNGIGSNYDEIKVFSNNGYIVDSINKYMNLWKTNNFKGIVNKALWIQYSSLTLNKSIIAVKLNNHTNEKNKNCYKVAKEEAQKAKNLAEEWAKFIGN